MFLGKMTWLADWSHLRGIPRVSAWVGSRLVGTTPCMVGVPVCILGSARAKPFFISYGASSFRASSALSYRSFLRDDTFLCRFYYFSCSVLQHNLGASNYYVFFSP